MHKTACSYSTPKHNYHIPLAQRFPEDIDCIVYSPHRDRGSLYISNIEAAENPSTLQRYCIKAVMSCAKGYVLNHSKSVVPHYLHIAAVDHQKCDISPYFDQAVDFIQNHLRTTNVLVHCLAGVSRSVSMVIAYFIREHALSDEEAFSLVKSRRKIINPNEGFRQQLKNYHLKMSSSRSQKIIQTYRQNKTPLKQFPQTYDTSKSFLLKNERTLSTDEKSSDANKIKQYCQNVENRRALFAEFKHNELKLQGRELRDKNKEKYYSPSKMQSYQQKKMQARMQQKGQKGYFCNLSQDLDQRIQKIKQKYQLHRQKLEQNLYQRHFQSTYEFSKFAKPESDTISHRIDRFKTHSYHQYTQKPNFQSDRENYTDFKTKRDLNGRAELNYKAQSPIRRTVASEVSENGLKSEDRMMNYSCFLSNEHYRVSGALQKKDEVMWGYKYMEMMSNASKKNYRQLN